MWKLGLTGSIASGKSTALKEFAALGVPTFSSDDAVHELYRGEAVPVVEALFPGVSHNGEIDRAELAKRVVEQPERLKDLEAAVHPLVRARIGKFRADAEASGAGEEFADKGIGASGIEGGRVFAHRGCGGHKSLQGM